MKAEIVSVGTEILLGEILDTNSQYLAVRLPPMGIDVSYVPPVGDNLQRLAETIGRAHKRSDLVLITGGLGPTEDDVTREAIALRLDEGMFVGKGGGGRVGASFPRPRAPAAPPGTAPGWWVEKDGRIIVAMPGPPPELERMWEVEVAPRLAQLATGGGVGSPAPHTTSTGAG